MTLVFPMTADDGFVFAATGAQYRGLAQRAARSLRAAMGDDIQIDLFADVAVDDPVFNQVHILDYVGTRPKMEALRESRFAPHCLSGLRRGRGGGLLGHVRVAQAV